jgi:hypothetical protein
MAYWTVAKLENHRNALALHCLSLKGFTSYYPHTIEKRIQHSRRIKRRVPLFVNYAFVGRPSKLKKCPCFRH